MTLLCMRRKEQKIKKANGGKEKMILFLWDTKAFCDVFLNYPNDYPQTYLGTPFIFR